MEIKKLIILGKSDGVISMILDNLESQLNFLPIKIYNNLNLEVKTSFDNLKFEISFIDNFDENNLFFLGVNKSQNKFKVFEKFNLKFDKFINLIHKSSEISTTSSLGQGCLINSLVSVAAHTTLGNFVSLNRNSSIGHHTKLEDFVTIQPGANVAGFVKIGEKTLVGMGANILDGISVGKNSIIGAGSVVTKDIPDNVIAFGNPCKIIKDNET